MLAILPWRCNSSKLAKYVDISGTSSVRSVSTVSGVGRLWGEVPSILDGNFYHRRCSSCRLVDLTNVTLACEDANSKLVVVVTVADVDA